MLQAISPPILIVGAGPAGLSLAIELTRWGVPFRVIDSAVGPNPWSRAFTVHARTAEWLANVGLIDDFRNHGLLHKSMDYWFEGVNKVARLDFTRLTGTRYPHILISNQNMTETLLRGYLASRGVTVEWGTELVAATEDPDGITATLSRPEGGEEVVRCEWLAGCDGVHSIVRDLLGEEFTGKGYVGRNRMIDAPVTNLGLDDDRINYLITQSRMLLITKLPGENHRVLLSEPGGAAEIAKDVVRDEFQQVLDGLMRGAARIGEPVSSSIFTVWKRHTPAYRRGRIFLAGDAGTVRSIAGGLGMNSCIADAVNLGWKLAAVASGKAHVSLLDTYEGERLPADKQVAEVADQLHRILMDHDRPLADRIAMVEEPGFQQDVTTMIAGLGYTYRDVIPTSAGVRALAGLTAGDRAPDVALTAAATVHDLLRHPGYTLLTLHHGPQSAWESTELAAQVRRRFSGLVQTASVMAPGQRMSAPTGTVIADNSLFHDVYGTPDADGACLIRPDGYLAGRAYLADHNVLLDDLASILA